MDRIVVAFANEEARHRICRRLESDGWSPAASCGAGAAAIRTARKPGSALSVGAAASVTVSPTRVSRTVLMLAVR